MAEEKQEGQFKMQKKKTTPRKLNKTDEPIKVDLSKPAAQAEPEITRVVIPSEPVVEKVAEEEEITIVNTQEPILAANPEPVVIIQEVTEQEIKEEAKVLADNVQEAIAEEKAKGIDLPENIQKVVDFMHETGGTLDDYVRLNADYSNVNNDVLLREYYRKTKPHLDNEEIAFLLEDNFAYDEDLDDERDIRKRKLAFKEEVAKAKDYLEGVKSKYYDEIKLRPGANKEQQQALDFFNRYKKDQEVAQASHDEFKTQTKQMFSQEFKGFDFNLGEKKFRYGVQNPSQIAETQSDINNIVGKFLGKDGKVEDVGGYHKAMYAAANADKLAQHFYEQGKADAIKEVVGKSKNTTFGEPRQAPENGFINGFKVKAVSSLDSSKLRIQTKKFN